MCLCPYKQVYVATDWNVTPDTLATALGTSGKSLQLMPSMKGTTIFSMSLTSDLSCLKSNVKLNFLETCLVKCICRNCLFDQGISCSLQLLFNLSSFDLQVHIAIGYFCLDF